MNEGLIPRRYAKALYKLAVEKNDTARLYAIMNTLAENFEKAPALSQTLANPFVPAADKTAILLTAANADDTLYADFLKLLVRNSRIMFMRDIALAYIQIYRQANNIYQVNVQSATPLSDDDEQRLRRLVAQHLNGATMEYNSSVNPSLIGGFTISVGNDRIDASIANELKQLRLNLISK